MWYLIGDLINFLHIMMHPFETARIASSVEMRGFEVFSPSVMEVDKEYNLVSGAALTVYNPQGEVIHDHIRGFMPIDEIYHLIRKEDGSWWYCTADGAPKRKQPLSKKNLLVGELPLMFDERGKIRLGQQSAHFPMLVLR